MWCVFTDVDENGRSIKLADGLLSARYRNGFARSEFLQEGEIVCLKIRTTKLSNCFRKGHRIRVTVTSSAKNFIFPNSNTREGLLPPGPWWPITGYTTVGCTPPA